MEFISAEEFLKQPVEVQKVFLEWWKLSIGDLYCCSKSRVLKCVDVDVLSEYENEGNFNNTIHCFNSISDKIIPLLSEGQLRQFIEGKTCGISSINIKCNNIKINIYDNNSPVFIKEYKNLGSNLLQAYWKVVLEIVKEEIKCK